MMQLVTYEHGTFLTPRHLREPRGNDVSSSSPEHLPPAQGQSPSPGVRTLTQPSPPSQATLASMSTEELNPVGYSFPIV